MLGTLQEAEHERQARINREIQACYDSWTKIYVEMKKEFDEVWELFGGVEERLQFWKRKAPCEGREGKWGPLGLSKRGYGFSAGLAKGDDPRATKWLLVGFGEGDRNQEGMGDERAFGFRGKPCKELAGLECCDGLHPEKCLESARALVERVEAYTLVFHLNHASLGQRMIHMPRNKLQSCSLSEICMGLFMAINDDDVKKLKGLAQGQSPLLLGQE